MKNTITVLEIPRPAQGNVGGESDQAAPLGQGNDTTFGCCLTTERITVLLGLIDRLNKTAYVHASLNLCNDYSEVHISLFYGKVYRCFQTDDVLDSNWCTTYGDTDLMKAEAFLRLLIREAEINPEMMGRRV